MSTTAFDRAMALKPLGGGRFEGNFENRWWIVMAPNGGILAAMTLGALRRAVDDPARRARSLSVHFHRPAAEGSVVIETDVLRAGKSLTSVTARMIQNDRLVATALGAFSLDYVGIEFDNVRMPDVPPPGEVPDVDTGGVVKHAGNFVYRQVIGDKVFSGSKYAEIGSWVRLKEPRTADELVVAALTDALPPSSFTLLDDAITAAPTVDLTVHFLAPVPADASPEDFYLGVFRSDQARDGFSVEDGAIFTESGTLLAHSRQLALLLPVG